MSKAFGIVYGIVGLAATAFGSYMLTDNYNKPLTIKQANILCEQGDKLIVKGKDAQYLTLSGKQINPKQTLEIVMENIKEVSGLENASKAKLLIELTTELNTINKNLNKNTKPEIYGPAFVSAGNKLNSAANREGTDKIDVILAGLMAGMGLFFLGAAYPIYKE